jgi:hypothetical protein
MKTIKFLALIAFMFVLAGCATPTSITIEHEVTDDSGVTEKTFVEGSALPRHWENLNFEWGEAKLQGGSAIVSEPDYAEIIRELQPVIRDIVCAENPLACNSD